MMTKSTEAPLEGDASEDTKSSEAYPGEAFYRREARLKHALDEATRRREEELYRLETERIRRKIENERREIENELRRVASIREEGIELGRVRQQRTSIRNLLRSRFGSVDAAIEEALAGKTDMDELERLLFTAAMCGSLDEFKASL